MRHTNVHLQLQSLNEKAALDADSNALSVRCLQAEAEVVELKGKIDMMKQRSGYQENPTINQSLDLYCAIPQLCSWRRSPQLLFPSPHSVG